MRVGVDFGGTKIEAIAMGAGGAILARKRVPNPGAYEAAIAAVAVLVGEMESQAGEKAAAVGVGMPGSLSPATGKVRNSNSVWLNGKPFYEDLKRALGKPLRCANDANCFALSEATDGAAADAKIVFGVILGTGCGGGVVVNGKVWDGVNGIGGEWGHIPLPWPTGEESQAEPCWCGRPLCLETWVSGSALDKWGSRIMGRQMGAREISAAAAAGDPKALECMDVHADRLARAVAVVMDILDPDIFVFGGGLSNVDSIYPALIQKLPPYVFSDKISTRFVKNMHGDSSGVRGAAWLFSEEEAR
ncbi:MAG: ROK family protein [Caulobacterales bacterium]